VDTALWTLIGTNGRAKATELMGARQETNQRVVTQYREALAQMERNQFDSASITLQAVLIRAQANPVFQGDYAYTLARKSDFENSGNIYTRAYQLQQQNAWFVVGIAAARAGHEQWSDAAGTIQLAAQTDSSVMVLPVVTAAVTWFQRANDRGGSMIWARKAAQLGSHEPQVELLNSQYLYTRGDSSGEGLAAIRRYMAVRPNDPQGQALYAVYLVNAGQLDSALILSATSAGRDSAYWDTAARIHLYAGRERLQRRDPETAIRYLTTAKGWAQDSLKPTFANLTGRAQLMQANTALGAFTDPPACGPARHVDSLVTDAERNLRIGMASDSARVASLLENIVPALKTNAANAVRACREPSAAPAPAHAPARPPARPARP
jgi:predicted Zn-dependent protease